jgi:hypothetical protein
VWREWEREGLRGLESRGFTVQTRHLPSSERGLVASGGSVRLQLNRSEPLTRQAEVRTTLSDCLIKLLQVKVRAILSDCLIKLLPVNLKNL